MALGHFATPNHTTLALDPFANRLAQLLDGTRNAEALSAQLTTLIEQGELLLVGGGKKLERNKLQATIRANVERLLNLFAREGVLESPPDHTGQHPWAKELA